jgi:hypothetical protein
MAEVVAVALEHTDTAMTASVLVMVLRIGALPTTVNTDVQIVASQQAQWWNECVTVASARMFKIA